MIREVKLRTAQDRDILRGRRINIGFCIEAATAGMNSATTALGLIEETERTCLTSPGFPK
jgi:hypothetical protein